MFRMSIVRLAAWPLALFILLFELRVGGRGEPSLGVSFVELGPASAVAREAGPVWPGPFRVKMISVRDGDTVDVRFEEGPCGRGPCRRQILAVRVLGVDTPESRPCQGMIHGGCAACDDELRLGLQAKRFTAAFVDRAPLRVAALRPDKYNGRIVGDLQALHGGRWHSLGPALTHAGLAVPYDGGRKSKPWCGRN